MATNTKSTTSSAVKKNGTLVATCTCAHVYQDKQYGTKRRLMNICAKGAKKRCTVCAREYNLDQ